MNRKEFIKTCSLACLGSSALGAILQSCSFHKAITGKITGDDLIVDIAEFGTDAEDANHYRNYLVVQHNLLKYPICVYKLNVDEYTALWMRCTHQGTELQVFGDTLQCPAHGSEFDNRGSLRNGPADKPLRTFPVRIENDQLLISLKAI